MLSSRGSDILGHFRSHSDQGGLLCSVVRHVSSQLTRLSGDFGRKKCRDPLYNVFVVSKELQKLAQEDREFDEQAVAALSPYIRHHINRFGHYQLDLTQHSPPIEYDLPIPTKKRQEQLTGQATPTRRKKKPKKKRKKTAVRQMRLFSAEEDT